MNKAVVELTDEELYAELREQVNHARNFPARYNGLRTRALSGEARRRGWALGRPQEKVKHESH